MNDTAAALIAGLQKRLNDIDGGNYIAAYGELLHCINVAKTETELITKCHIDTLAVTGAGQIEAINETPVTAGAGYTVGQVLTLAGGTATIEVVAISGGGATGPITKVKLLTRGVGGYSVNTSPGVAVNTGAAMIGITVIRASIVSGTPTYDHGPVFEPIEVGLHWSTTFDGPLTKKSLKDLQADQDYNLTASGQPTCWYPLSGSTIGLYPAPNQNASATYYLRVRGYAVSADLVSTYDRPTSIPEGYRVPVLLDRAAAEAIDMRLTTIPNVERYAKYMARWEMWCNRIIDSLKGAGR